MLKNAYFLAKIGADTAELIRQFRRPRDPPGGRFASRRRPLRAQLPDGLCFFGEPTVTAANPLLLPRSGQKATISWK